MVLERAEAIRTAGMGARAAVATRRPVLFTLTFFIAGAVAIEVVAGLIALLPGTEPYVQARNDLLTQLVRSALIVAVLVALGWWRAVGFTPPRSWRSLHLLWLPSILLVVFAAVWVPGLATIGRITGDARWLSLSVPAQLLVGFYEEAWFRGLVLFVLLYAWWRHRHGVLWAVLVSSALFGILHVTNLAGQTAPETLTQVVDTFMTGVGLAALVLRTNTLWPAIIWHGLWDVVAIAIAGPAPHPEPELIEPVLEPPIEPGMEPAPDLATSAVSLLLSLSMLIFGLILIRRSALTRAAPASYDTTHTPPTTSNPE